MKIRSVFTAIVLSVLFLSCSKRNSTSSNAASVTFMANNTAYTMPFNMIRQIISDTTIYYLLIANNTPGDNISLGINSPTVAVGSYSYGGESDFNYIHYTGTSTTVTITSVHNGLADGNFASTQSQNTPTGNGKVVITSGVFKNVLYEQ